MLFERAQLGDVGIEGGLGGDAFGLAIGHDVAIVDPVGEPEQPLTFGAVAAHQFDLANALQVGDRPDSFLCEFLLRHAADAENERDRLRRQEVFGFSFGPSTAKPRGLSRSEAILARNLLAESPIETVIPISFSTLREKRASDLAGLMPCTRAVPDEIHERFVDRDRLDQRGEIEHQAADVARDLGIFRHVGRNDRRMRAQSARLEHRHRRAHAEGAGKIAGGGDHAAFSAADDQRLVGERGVVALFDRGVERIAIDMRERKVVEFAMTDEARGAAIRATRLAFGCVGEAIAAEAGRQRSWQSRS